MLYIDHVSVIVKVTVGPSDAYSASSASVNDTFPVWLTCNCTRTGVNGGTCTASGSSNISDDITLPVED